MFYSKRHSFNFSKGTKLYCFILKDSSFNFSKGTSFMAIPKSGLTCVSNLFVIRYQFVSSAINLKKQW